MPLYPDEVSFRLNGARLFVDDGLQYGLYPACASNFKATHPIFYPVAAFYAILDSLPEWEGIRFIPFISLFLSVLVALSIISKSRFGRASGIFLIGFIGVSGSGLILSRPEWVLLVHGMACLVSFYVLLVHRRSELIICLVISGLTFVALLSLYLHIQGAIFIPLTMLPLVLYSFKSDISQYARSLTVTAIFIILIGVWASIQQFHFRCSELPALEHFISAMTIAGAYNEKGLLQSVVFLLDKCWRYIGQFQFKEVYDVNYLPSAIPVSKAGQYVVKLINASITFLLLVNLFCSFSIANYSGVLIVKKLFISANGLTIRERLYSSSPYLFIFFAIGALLGLFVYDAATNFYRSFYLNLLMAITNGIVLSFSASKLRWVLRQIGVISLLTCFCSTILTFEIIRPKIQSGQVGPSLALDTDWGRVRADVNQLKQACDINDKTTKIMMDDMTYDALKQHSHLISFTYFSFSASLSGGSAEDQLQAHSALFKRVSPNAAIMLCSNFSTISLTPTSQKSSLCCAKF
ncbi:MAG: hypothetical protein Q7T79_00830 [bacterium]|nr:hypothetical protein [bacterium]